MSKKISLGAAVGFIFLAIAVTVAVTLTVSGNVYNSLLKKLPERIESYELLEEVKNVVAENYYGEVPDSVAVEGYIDGLEDDYSRYLTASEYSEYLLETKGQMSGIGIKFKNKNNRIRITSVVRSSPAETAGLQPGDTIVAVDGIALDEDNYKEMAAKFSDSKLTYINITYKRSGEEKTIDLTMGYEARSVEKTAIEKIGYIKITDFYSSTPSLVKEAVDDFISQGAEGLVLDLRDTSSTNYDAAVNIIDIFVPTTDELDYMASIVNSKGETTFTYTSDAANVALPVVVLVNEDTLGSPELVAVDLRDFGKASVVGQTTAGMGIAQNVFKLSNGDAVILSVGEVLSYRSGSYNGKGVTPDQTVASAEKSDDISSDAYFAIARQMIEEQGGISQEG